MLQLEGRTAIITGGSRGIGLAIARTLGMAGAHVAIAARGTDALDAAEDDLRSEGIAAKAFQADILSESGVRDLVGAVVANWGGVGVLVANAGGGGGINQPMQTLATDDWNGTVALNLNSTFFCVRQVLPLMVDAGWGRVITMSSRAAVGGGVLRGRGQPRACDYAASKAGIVGFTQAVAIEVAGTGVTANVIAPGPIATESFLQERRSTAIADAVANVPVGRLGKPEDIAHAANYLATDGGFITGQVLHVNGGTWIG